MKSKWLRLLVLAVGSWTTDAIVGRATQRAETPNFVSGAIPLLTNQEHQFGFARIKIRAGKDGRVSADIVEAVPAALGPLLIKDIGRWRFDGPLPDTSLEVRFIEWPDKCGVDQNNRVELALPARMVIFAMRDTWICEDRRPLVMEMTQPGTVRGAVTTDANVPLSGVVVSLYGRERLEGFMRHVATDEEGEFAWHDLPVGRYRGQFSHPDHETQEFTLTVEEHAPATLWRQRLAKTTVRDPSTVVISADVPTYPTSELRAGIGGTVDLRVSFSQNPADRTRVLDVDADGEHPALIKAARDNVATWEFANVKTPVLKIRFVFLAAPGDCKEIPRTTASMRFPSSVDILGRTSASCVLNVQPDLFVRPISK